MPWKSFPVEESLHIENFHSFFETYYDASFRFCGESHDFWECVYVEEGGICASADARVYDLEKGQIIIHKPLEFHKFHVNTDAGANLVIFSFSLTGPLAHLLCNRIIQLSDEEQHILDLLLSFMRANKNPLAADARDFLNYDSSIPWYMQTVRSYLYLLLLSFTRNDSVVKIRKDFDSVIYQKAVQHMTEHIAQNLSISQIAEACNVCTTSLKQIFAKYAGIGIHKFFLQLKLRRAVELLKTGYTVTEVSIALGFCSQPYFTSTFKRELGYTPSAVRSPGKRYTCTNR